LAEKVHQRLDAPARYKGKRLSLRAILQTQARELAVFLREDEAEFNAYLTQW
jgi:hypothetical protein